MKKRNIKADNDAEIQRYLSESEREAQQSETGLYYSITKQGNGAHPSANSNISISYIGYLTNGEVFDYNENLEIHMSDVIAGWTEGIQYFKEGGEGVLFIPSHLAYGNTACGSIPAGSVLIFDIKLLKVY